MPFDPQQLLQALPHILGAASGLRGAPGFAERWQQLEQMDQQRKQQAQQMQTQQAQLQIQQQAAQRAQQEQLIQAANSIRQLADPTGIGDPAVYQQRHVFAQNIADRLGIDRGFVDSIFNVPESQFEINGVKQKLAEIEKQYPTAAERQQLEDSPRDASGNVTLGPVFPLRNGKKLTVTQMRMLVGWQPTSPTGEPMSMRPPTNTDKRGFASKDITFNGKRMLANYDPDTGEFYAVGDNKTPLRGDIQEYQRPPASTVATPGGLSPRVQQAVNSQSKGWDSLPIVKNVQKQAEAVSFTEEMKKDPGNPANDIGLIYAFAKAMDPDSVVREGEYATVQKYAQSWAQTFGFNVQRIFSNVPFLSDEARRNMAATITAKYRVGRKQYDAVRKSYASKIDKITGSNDGDQYLTDYTGGFPADTSAPSNAPITRPAGANPFRSGNAR